MCHSIAGLLGMTGSFSSLSILSSGCGTLAMTQYESLTVCGCVGDLRLNVTDEDLIPSLIRFSKWWQR